MLGCVDLTCLAFLDDDLTPTRDHKIVNEVLGCMQRYGKKWDINWAMDKFRVLSFNTIPSETTWAFANASVAPVTQHKYLGVIHMTQKPFWRAHYTEKIAVAQFILHGLRKAFSWREERPRGLSRCDSKYGMAIIGPRSRDCSIPGRRS